MKFALHTALSRTCWVIALGGWLASAALVSAADSTVEQLAQLRQIPAGDDSAQAQAAKTVSALAKDSKLDVLTILKAMKGATPIGKNWLLSLANRVHVATGSETSTALEAFFGDASQDPEARYTVFRWLTDEDADKRNRMLATLLNDPSLEIRYDAVAQALGAGATLDATRLKQLLDAARHPAQVAEIIEKLKGAGVEVQLSEHMGFLSQWKLIGPFDNVGSDKFDVVYDVESDWIRGATKPSYTGKSGDVKWIEHTTDNAEGQVDLSQIYDKEKGCIVYGATSVTTPSPLDCEIRIGCINAQKVWVNGELVISNEVYHTGMQVDQYSAPIRLKAGENRILVKICQNEQKEAWAQNYVFQVRICDATGKAIRFSGN
jgi:hypothetical protein